MLLRLKQLVAERIENLQTNAKIYPVVHDMIPQLFTIR